MIVTPQVIEALRWLREESRGEGSEDPFNILDNAGVFAAIDEAATVNPEPEYEWVETPTGEWVAEVIR